MYKNCYYVKECYKNIYCQKIFLAVLSYIMKISPITNTHIYNKYPIQKPTPALTSASKRIINKQSCYFRRGAVVLASKAYEDIENLFYEIFKTGDYIRNMLTIGVGKSQEPFSHLATIKGILKNRLLSKNLDLNTIDLQPKPSEQDLKMQSFWDLHDYENCPEFAKESFVKDTFKHWLDISEEKPEKIDPLYYFIPSKPKKPQPPTLYYRVNDEIFEFLKNTYNNPQKSKWNSAVQDVIKDYPDNKYNIIAANNTLGYIMDDTEFVDTHRHIVRILRQNGYLITDPYGFEQKVVESGVMDNMEEVYKGIYKKRA